MPSLTEPIDFLIITALEEERDAVLAKLPGWRKLDRDGTGTHTYYEAYITTKRGDGATYRLIVTMLSGMGPLNGAIKADAVIHRWNPEHVLVVGIAGGVSKETAPGDVIVADQVVDYTLGKVRDSGPREERWVSYLADANLIDGAKNFPSGWENLVMCSRPKVGRPKRHFGVIASGGDVVDSRKQIAIYRQDWPKLIGVEMEGAGVAAALHSHIARPRFLMVRGVSDLADAENNAATKAVWRLYACDVAAAYAIGLLREGPVARTSKRPPLAESPESQRKAPSVARDPRSNWRRWSADKRFIALGIIAMVTALSMLVIALSNRILIGEWDRAAATKRVLAHLRKFGGPREYNLGDSSSGGGVSHKVHDFFYVKYIDHAAYIAVGITQPDPPDDFHGAAPSLSFMEFVERPFGWELGAVHVNALHDGAWGEPPSGIRAMDIGYNIFGIVIEGGYLGQGYLSEYTSIHTTVAGEFKEVFRIDTSGNDSAAWRSGDDSWSTDIEVVRKGTSFYDLVVHRKGRRGGKALDERQIYRFDGRAYAPADLYQ